MVLGPFSRILAQVTFVAGGAVLRAVREAWKEAAKNPDSNGMAKSVLGRRMKLEEALNILEVRAAMPNPKLDSDAISRKTRMEAFVKEVNERSCVMVDINAIDSNGVGSPYLQDRVRAAQRILLKESEISADEL